MRRVGNGGLEELLRLAAELDVELARDGQQRVAQLFEREAMRRHSPQQSVLGVESRAPVRVATARWTRRGLTIRGRQQDQAVQPLEAPAVGDEASGEPVEQFGVAGGLGPGAEVAQGADQAGPEVVHPDPVDRDTSGQRVLRINDRPGHLKSAAPVWNGVGLGPAIT